MSTIKQFAIFTSDRTNLERAVNFIRQHDLKHEIHLNRIRFWVPPGAILTEFYLRFETFSVVQDH
jgi:hypothetical protein